jgi:hypothetical protein
MKYFPVILLALISFRATAGTNLGAVAYNQTIMLEQDRIGYRLSGFMQHVSGKNLILLQMQILNSVETINALQPFDNDSTLLIAARNLFNCYKDVAKYQYPKILELVENPNVDDDQFDKQLIAIKKEISDIESPFDKLFSLEQEKFAKKYGFEFNKE